MGGYKPTKAELERENKELRAQVAGSAPDAIRLAPAQLGAILRAALDSGKKSD